MPHSKIDYSKTVIYKIVCKSLNIKDLYVGNTTDFTRRKTKHKHCCNNPTSKSYNLKVYEMIRKNGGWDNWEMVLVETYPCKNQNEASAKEREWYENLNANMNVQYPHRTTLEYRLEKRDIILEQRKIYYNENKEELYRKHRLWDIQHAEEIREYKANWRAINADKIKERYKTICKCECGKEYTLWNKTRHQKSKYHIDKLNV